MTMIVITIIGIITGHTLGSRSFSGDSGGTGDDKKGRYGAPSRLSGQLCLDEVVVDEVLVAGRDDFVDDLAEV